MQLKKQLDRMYDKVKVRTILKEKEREELRQKDRTQSNTSQIQRTR